MEPEKTESNFLIDLLAWIEVNKRRLITGGVVIVAGWVVIYTYTYFKGQQEVAAEEAMSAVFKAPLGNPVRSLPEPAGLLAVADRYASAPAGQRALLLAAGALFQQGKFPEAKEKFQKFSSQYADSKLVPIAAYGAAACEDAANNLDAALTAYQAVEQKYPKDPVATQAKLAIGVIHEAKNKPEEALKVYDQLAKVESRSLWSSEAFSRRDLLLAKFPHLMPPPPVTAVGTNAPVMVGTNAALMNMISNAMAKAKAEAAVSNAVAPSGVVSAVSNAAVPVITAARTNAATAVIQAIKTNAPAIPSVPVPPAPTPTVPTPKKP